MISLKSLIYSCSSVSTKIGASFPENEPIFESKNLRKPTALSPLSNSIQLPNFFLNKTRAVLVGCLPIVKTTGSEEEAVKKIQACFRGYTTRKSFLPRSLYPKYSDLLKHDEKIQEEPRALLGKTPVYFPQAIPEVVIKKCGKKQAALRFEQMEYVRSVLREQKCFYLQIPPARLFGDCLVEKRLPIPLTIVDNIRTYVNRKNLFDLAVRDMVRLYSRAYINYLVLEAYQPFNDYRIRKIRYDNICFFIDESGGEPIGKIALVDLERAKKIQPTSEQKRIVRVAQMFPLHTEILKKECRSLGLYVEDRIIDAAAEKSKMYMLDNIGKKFGIFSEEYDKCKKILFTPSQLS